MLGADPLFLWGRRLRRLFLASRGRNSPHEPGQALEVIRSLPPSYIAIGDIHRPHPRPAVDLDGEGARLRAAAKAQGRDTGRIGLVGDDIDAAEDHLIDGLGRERLAQQQWAGALHRESTGVNGPGPPRTSRNGVRAPSTMWTPRLIRRPRATTYPFCGSVPRARSHRPR